MINVTTISGTRDSGKTSLLKKVIPLLDNPLGVISDKVYDAERRLLGYDCVLIPSGDRYPLCRVYSDESFTETQGRYNFDTSVFNLVSDYILSNYSCQKTILIDEIGNLEMIQHRGYYGLLVWLFNQDSLQIILTIRG